MVKCSHCNKEFEEYRGTIVVDSITSSIKHFCSSKCRKNSNLDRRRKRKWQKQVEKK